MRMSGVYLDASLYPSPQLSTRIDSHMRSSEGEGGPKILLLGPFCGKPACQSINVEPGKARGVCANAFITTQTIVVRNVDEYPGHIACDGKTKSEIVCPLILDSRCVGVLDLDCLALGGFGEEDRVGLERIAKLIVESSDW